MRLAIWASAMTIFVGTMALTPTTVGARVRSHACGKIGGVPIHAHGVTCRAARRIYKADMGGEVPRGWTCSASLARCYMGGFESGRFMWWKRTTYRMAAAGSRTLVFREPHRGSTEKFVDLFPLAGRRHPSFSPGDEFLFTNRLERRGRRVGRIHVICTATQSGRNAIRAGFMCNILAKVPGGTLVMASPYAERGNPNGREGAVVGGTGAYAGARGTFDDEMGRRFDTNTITLLE